MSESTPLLDGRHSRRKAPAADLTAGAPVRAKEDLRALDVDAHEGSVALEMDGRRLRGRGEDEEEHVRSVRGGGLDLEPRMARPRIRGRRVLLAVDLVVADAPERGVFGQEAF